jgi:hypothetical protein
MRCHRPRATPTPNAHKRKDSSRAGNAVSKYEDKHGMERHKVQGKLEVDGAAKVVQVK